ncbi:hypothetical protein CSUI_009248 [Cystoisospora suis]|uniref:Uncharacterized protein n=1 Tax=Cystoisospora suis TaxID=483139 RepID=A0A2C6KIK2_9APIC|nr:hypothetical protein CSUI_009248 [Cystoisospora suis]
MKMTKKRARKVTSKATSREPSPTEQCASTSPGNAPRSQRTCDEKLTADGPSQTMKEAINAYMEQRFLSKFAPKRARDRRLRCTKAQQEHRHRQHLRITNRKSTASSAGQASRPPHPYSKSSAPVAWGPTQALEELVPDFSR